MKKLLLISVIMVLLNACQTPYDKQRIAEIIEKEKAKAEKERKDSLLIIDNYKKIDSINAAVTQNIKQCPIEIISAKYITQEYSSYQSMRLVWKNISKKTIIGIKFEWRGYDAFGEIASGGERGYTDDILKPGRTDNGTWSINSNGKKVDFARPYEIAFEDGTKWYRIN